MSERTPTLQTGIDELTDAAALRGGMQAINAAAHGLLRLVETQKVCPSCALVFEKLVHGLKRQADSELERQEIIAKGESSGD